MAPPPGRAPPPSGPGRRGGHLLVIGGHEDQSDERRILSRFVALAGGPLAHVVVLTAASHEHERMARIYSSVFAALGVPAVSPLRIPDRQAASDPGLAHEIATADGIFLTGGDQDRLIATIGGTPVAEAIRCALRSGACVAGTSAGASALAARMPGPGRATDRDLDPSHASPGLGLLHRTTIDQHFTERRRLARLLAMVAADPGLLGLGIDEDTAIAIRPGAWLEVLGKGAVTVLDARWTTVGSPQPGTEGRRAVFGVRLHRLPDGFSCRIDPPSVGEPSAGPQPAHDRNDPSVIHELVTIVTDVRIDRGLPPD